MCLDTSSSVYSLHHSDKNIIIIIINLLIRIQIMSKEKGIVHF